MQEIGRVTTKIKLGGGLNLLAIAGAGYLAVKTLTKMVECNNAVKHGEMIEALHKSCKELNEMIKQKNPKKMRKKARKKGPISGLFFLSIGGNYERSNKLHNKQ